MAVAPSRLARRVLAGLAVAAAVLTVALAGRVWWSAATEPTGVDFVALYAGGVLARRDVVAVYDLAEVRAVEEAVLDGRELSEDVLPFPYPPFFAAALVPLALLPFRTAFLVATVLNALCLAAVFVLLCRRLVRGAAARAWLAVVVGLSLPVWFTFVQGQVSLLALLLVALCALDLRDGRTVRAGVWLGLLTFKPQLVPLLAAVIVARRAWRTLGAAALVTVALWAPSLAWLGETGIARYAYVSWRMTSAFDELGVHPARMYNLRALRLAVAGEVAAGSIATWVATLAVVAVVLRMHRPRPADAHRQWAATVLALVLVSPHVNVHDLALVVLPCALLLAGDGDRVPGGRLGVALALALAPLGSLLASAGLGWQPPVVPVVLALAWAGLVVRGGPGLAPDAANGSMPDPSKAG